jgi:hypothetical protein
LRGSGGAPLRDSAKRWSSVREGKSSRNAPTRRSITLETGADHRCCNTGSVFSSGS